MDVQVVNTQYFSKQKTAHCWTAQLQDRTRRISTTEIHCTRKNKIVNAVELPNRRDKRNNAIMVSKTHPKNSDLDENRSYPLVSLVDRETLSQRAEVIYASGKQVWFRFHPSDEERDMLGRLAQSKTKQKKYVEIDPIYKIIGANIHRLRLERKWSCERIAEMTGYDHHSSIFGIEKGEQTLDVHRLIAFARAFQCSVNDLLENHG